MRAPRSFGLTVFLTVGAVLLTSTGVSASPLSTATATATASVAGPDIAPPPDSALNEIFVPPASAGEQAAGDPAAPEDAWEATEEPRAGEPQDVGRGAPVGTPVGAPGLGALPYFGFDQLELSADTVARVNLGNGNLLLTANDGILSGPGLSLRNDRFYNGLSSTTGSLGGGWSSALSAADTGLSVTSTTADFVGPNGFTVQFTKSGGVWTAPAGFNAQLTQQPYTYTITYNQSGEQLIFNSAGWLLQNLNRNGVGTSFTYSAGKIATATEASGRQFSVTWTGSSIASVTDSAGRTTTYTRNSLGQLSRVDSPGGLWSEFDYDASGRISEARFLGTNSTTVNRAVFAYDANSKVTAIQRGVVGASGFLTASAYDYSGSTTTVTDGRGKTSSYAIDSAGRVESATNALGNARSQTWTANSDVQDTTDAFGAGTGNTTTAAYDALNNQTSVTLPTGAAASAQYALGVGCAGTGSGTVYQVKCATDDAGNSTAYDYDANGNLLTATDTTAGGTGATTQNFTYETTGSICGGFAGQVCTSTDGNSNTTSYAYDSDGNLTSVTPPAPQGASTYTYDSLGRTTSVIDGNGDITTYTYNPRDQLRLTTFDSGDTTLSNYFSNALLYNTTDSVGPVRVFFYDGLGRTVKEQQFTAGLTWTMDYTYDPAGNLTTFTDSKFAPGAPVTYVYDDANQLIQTIEPGGTCTSGTTAPAANSGCIKFEYDVNGAETKRTFPGGATVTTAVDEAGRPTRITAADSTAAARADVAYSYTAAGGTGPTADRTSIQTRTSLLEQGITPGAVTAYTYDSLSRLTAATETVGATTSASWAYAYDPAGNRTTQTRAGATGATAGTIGYTYDAAKRLTATTSDTASWAHDGAGNQTANGITGLASVIDDRGAVLSNGPASYVTHAAGNADTRSRLVGSTTTRYLTSSLGLSGEEAGSALRAFTRTPDGEALANRLGGGSRYYYATDHLGSVIGMLSATGSWLGGYSYSPYGEERGTATGTALTTNSLRYIGGYYDASAGLYKLGARYYDPSLGRFTQFDPSGQETNPYSYAACDPVNASDPSGLVCQQVLNAAALGLISATLGGGAIVATGTILGAPAGAVLAIGSAATGIGAGVSGIIALFVC